jgi:hypothetical protein
MKGGKKVSGFILWFVPLVTFVTLKLTGGVDWHWFIVLSPIWIDLIITFLAYILLSDGWR